jgi:hypothetical protein
MTVKRALAEFAEYAPKVLPRRLSQWATPLHLAAGMTSQCPWLLSAILERESRGGEALTPPGPAGTGDGGHGRGLMQIDDRFHSAFVSHVLQDGRPAWQDAAVNIAYGANVLRGVMSFFRTPAWALSSRVADAAGVASYNAGQRSVAAAMRREGLDAAEHKLLAAIDSPTTGRNYSAWVLAMRDSFLAAVPQGDFS